MHGGYWIFVDKEGLLLYFRGFQNSFRDSLIVSSREIDSSIKKFTIIIIVTC